MGGEKGLVYQRKMDLYYVRGKGLVVWEEKMDL